MYLLESPHRGDSNEYTQYTIFNMKRKNTLNHPKSAAMGFFPGTKERVRNSPSTRAISVRATEVLLHFVKIMVPAQPCQIIYSFILYMKLIMVALPRLTIDNLPVKGLVLNPTRPVI